MTDLKVTIIQSNIHWEDKAANMKMFADKILAITESTDLIVLPEMFTTGFSMNPVSLAETMDGETVNWMQLHAAKKRCAISGSFICEENGKYYNRLVWVNESGTCSVYDKRHLFSMGAEHEHYSHGNNKLIVTLKGWNICPLICYDLRFPVWSRNTKNNPYDLLLYVANWPERRQHPWKTLLLARAIENQSYVVGLNRVGNDVHGIHYSGDSSIINFKGEIISFPKPEEEFTETITLKYADLMEFRKEFPVLNDAD